MASEIESGFLHWLKVRPAKRVCRVNVLHMLFMGEGVVKLGVTPTTAICEPRRKKHRPLGVKCLPQVSGTLSGASIELRVKITSDRHVFNTAVSLPLALTTTTFRATTPTEQRHPRGRAGRARGFRCQRGRLRPGAGIAREGQTEGPIDGCRAAVSLVQAGRWA